MNYDRNVLFYTSITLNMTKINDIFQNIDFILVIVIS